MAKSIGQLIQDYKKANNARHLFYANRSRAASKAIAAKFGADRFNLSKEDYIEIRMIEKKTLNAWNRKHGKAMKTAIAKKKEVSKQLRTQLKKNGLCVIWGDRNQILGIELITTREQRNKRERARRLRQLNEYRAQQVISTLDKLDLV